jgi:hypothetical protein
MALGSTTLGLLRCTALRPTALRPTALGFLTPTKCGGLNLNIGVTGSITRSHVGRAQSTAEGTSTTAVFFVGGGRGRRRGRLLVGRLGLLQNFHEAHAGMLFANVGHVSHPCIKFFCHL